ncbi:DNA-directed primase/polymerase protein [Picochlorum sp. SENEW3]|nr:DNA-directed primase/polymerase protein [Picochlorum sp. SENEW3]
MPLHSNNPTGKFLEASYRGDVFKMKRILDKGIVDVNGTAMFVKADTHELEDCTALCLAARHGILYSVDFLIEYGADLDLPLDDGNTAIMEAARMGHLRVIVSLMEGGASLKLTNADGKTAADLAEENGYGLVARVLKDPSHVTMAEITDYTRDHMKKCARRNLRPTGFWGIFCRMPCASSSSSSSSFENQSEHERHTAVSTSNIHSLVASLSTLSVGRRRRQERKKSRSNGIDTGGGQESVVAADQLEDLFKIAEEAVDSGKGTRKGRVMGEPTFSSRCMSDTTALLADCPDSVRHIDTLFVKQADAIELADQCNKGLGELPRPTLVVSKDSNIPKQQNGLYVGDHHQRQDGEKASAEEEEDKIKADGGGEEEEEKIPAHHVFDFSQEDAECPDIYSDDGEEEDGGERVDAELRQKYMDILSELNKGIGEKSAAAGPGDEEKEETEEEKKKRELEDDKAILSRPRYPNVIRIFCREFLNSSKGMYYRKFNACSVAAAWKVHLENDPAKLHWYEVIRENFPCHLYFDLEFPRDAEGLNKDVDGDAYVDVLLAYVRKRLREGFSLEFPDANVYELDSSSEAKFSRHLIVRIENYAFYNNIAVGDFVAQVLAESGTSLFVKDKNKKDTYFVDTAVYTKNRHFRLVYSCKGGRKASLMPTHRFAMARQPLPTPAQIFKETMVTGVDPSATLLSVRPLHQFSSSKVQKAGVGTSNIRIDRGMVKKDAKDMLPDAAAMKKLQSIANAAIPFIEQFGAKRAGRPTTVRTVQICGGNGRVAYSMLGDGAHYCGNIGRDHQSNFIYYVANFSTLGLVQKCYDPDCRKYKSAVFDIPTKFAWNPE